MDEIEDYWERGPGATAPVIAGYQPLPRRLRVGPPRRAVAHGEVVREVDRHAQRLAAGPDRREQRRPRRAARLSPLERADAHDDAARRRRRARRGPRRGRGPRDRDARGVPRRQQRAAHGHRPVGQVERQRLQGPAQEGPVHGVAAVALHLRAGRARAGGRADRGAARHLVHGAARDDPADLPRRRPQGRARLALLPVLHAPVDHGRDVRSPQRPPHHRPAGARRRLRGGPLQRRDHGGRRTRADRLTGPRLVPARHRRAARPPGVAPLHPRSQRAPGVVVAVPAARAGEGARAHGGLAVPAQRRPRWAPHGWAVLARRRPPHDGRVRADRAGADQHHAHRRGGVPATATARCGRTR